MCINGPEQGGGNKGGGGTCALTEKSTGEI